MKTTLDISDDLLLRAKDLARERKTTLRSVVEEGLATVLNDDGQAELPAIAPVTFKGKGLQPEFAGKGWQAMEEAIPPPVGS